MVATKTLCLPVVPIGLASGLSLTGRTMRVLTRRVTRLLMPPIRARMLFVAASMNLSRGKVVRTIPTACLARKPRFLA